MLAYFRPKWRLLFIYSPPLNFPLSSLVKTDHVVRSRVGTICQKNALGQLSDVNARSAEVVHERQLSPTVFLDEMKENCHPILILEESKRSIFFPLSMKKAAANGNN